jgi:hypothetical protein
MKAKEQKRVKVSEMPATWIMVDADLDEAEVKAGWLRKHNRVSKPLSQFQIDRERATIREAKLYQRRHYK